MGNVSKVEVRPEPTGSKAPEQKTEMASSLEIKDAPAPEAPAQQTQQVEAEQPSPAVAPKYVISDDDIAPMVQEFEKSGNLSDDTLGKLESKGIPPHLAVRFVEGQKALQERNTNTVFDSIGGKEAYNKMSEWAANSLTPSEKETFNKTVARGNMNEIVSAVKGLHARYQSEYGSSPRLQGGFKGTAGPAPFRSMYEVREAMSDPLYSKDSAYRDDVIKRLNASNF
jgi:hypothetical protein